MKIAIDEAPSLWNNFTSLSEEHDANFILMITARHGCDEMLCPHIKFGTHLNKKILSSQSDSILNLARLPVPSSDPHTPLSTDSYRASDEKARIFVSRCEWSVRHCFVDCVTSVLEF